MFYSGSISPPREPPRKKFVIPAAAAMSEAGTSAGVASSGGSGSTLLWPMLTRTNYTEWAMLMQCNYEAMEIWEAIEPGTNVKRPQDRQAMSALLRSVPKEMWTTLGAKKSVKEAWEVVKTMRLGADRVKDVNAQKLIQEFENISFKDGESVDDFGMRINNLVANLRNLGETVEETKIVKKFLRVAPARFTQVVVSIEMFCDLKTMKLEELVGSCVRQRIAWMKKWIRSSTRPAGCCWQRKTG